MLRSTLILFLAIGFHSGASQSMKRLDEQLSSYRTQYWTLVGSRGYTGLEPGAVDAKNLLYRLSHFSRDYNEKKDVALIFYHFDSDGLSVWLLAQGRILSSAVARISQDSLGSLERNLKRQFTPDRTQLGKRGGTAEILTAKSTSVDSILNTLTKVLLPDTVSSKLQGVGHLIIIPSLNISSLPFHMLKPWKKSRDYLIDRISYSFADSFDSFFKVCAGEEANYPWRKVIERGNDVDKFRVVNPVVVGNPTFADTCTSKLKPLGGAEAEAKLVSKRLGVSPLLAGAATKDVVVASILKSNFIYLATHGRADADDPMRKSWLALHQPGGCGLLYTKEIQDWSKTGGLMPGTLVILSACQSGLGKTHSAGVIGISRAFTLAGAQNVTMSLWNIDDENTAVIMKYYVEELAKPQQFFPAENLRQALLRFKAINPNPYYWAAFQNFGVPFPEGKPVALKAD